MTIFRSHWDYRNMSYEVMPHSHLVRTRYVRTVGFAPKALSPAQADLRWPRLFRGSWPGTTPDSFSIPFHIMGDKAGGRRFSLWDTVVWDSGMLRIQRVFEIQNVSYLDKVTEVMTTVKKKKSSIFPYMYKTVQFKYKWRFVCWLGLFYYLCWTERHHYKSRNRCSQSKSVHIYNKINKISVYSQINIT